jgi:hypothetical protein
MNMHPHFWLNFPKANFLGNMAFVNYCITEAYEMNLDFPLKNHKANFADVSEMNLSSLKTKYYKNKRLFRPK